MDECQNVIDFEELEKLCSSEIRFDGDQENNLQINVTNNSEELYKTENNNLSNVLNNKEARTRKETKETEAQTEAFDEKDFIENNCDVTIDETVTERDYNSGIDNMVKSFLLL